MNQLMIGKGSKETESANKLFLRFSLVYYFVMMCSSLLQYLALGRRLGLILFFWGTAAAVLGQTFLFLRYRWSQRYGVYTLVIFSALFTYQNLIFGGTKALLLPIPMITLCMLYMDSRVLAGVYWMWGINALLRLVLLAFNDALNMENGMDYMGTALFSLLSAAVAYRVNQFVSSHYSEVCHTLHHENQLHTQLYRQSTVDSTTGLLNRNAYNAYLAEYEEGSHQSLSCVYIDVNGLHEYNNTYGHQAGDKMLKMVAAELKQCFEGHKQYRIGGDEFVIISEDLTFKAVLEALKSFREQMRSHRIYIASGMEWRDEGMDLNDMIKKADAKMYLDKERFYKDYPQGRDQAGLYSRLVE